MKSIQQLLDEWTPAKAREFIISHGERMWNVMSSAR